MRSVAYGSRMIDYTIEETDALKSHYIAVDRHSGVVLKGKAVDADKADKLVLNKARWIIDKLDLVKSVDEEAIVTGSRIQYIGKKYYAEVIFDCGVENASVNFTHSKFIITVNPNENTQEAIRDALEAFYRIKAEEKITPRIRKLSKETGLEYKGIKIRAMQKRWGSCTGDNTIIINPKAILLPFTLIDYLLVHELTHTKVKSHAKAFWNELGRHCRDWRKLDEKINAYNNGYNLSER